MNFIESTYLIKTESDEVNARVEAVLLEQSVETPLSVATRYPFVRDHMLGRVVSLEPDRKNGHVRAVFALPLVTASADTSQFLNVLFGNSSLHDDVELVDFQIPEPLKQLFPGPRYGLDGLRRLCEIRDRPLTCSALKPVGLSVNELANLCADFIAGGIDLIKDDHYLADQAFSPFAERVRACLDATAEAAVRRGRPSIYIPNLSGAPEAIRRQADAAQAAGAKAVMIAPMLTGLPLLHELTTTRLEIPLLAHPSFGGSTRLAPSLLFGKLFRLYGADAVIFANYGGRFSYKPETCRKIADNLRSDWLWLKRSMPVPAGGMTVDRAKELVNFFGNDVILLVGGSLLEAGEALVEKTRSFTDAVRSAASRT